MFGILQSNTFHLRPHSSLGRPPCVCQSRSRLEPLQNWRCPSSHILPHSRAGAILPWNVGLWFFRLTLKKKVLARLILRTFLGNCQLSQDIFPILLPYSFCVKWWWSTVGNAVAMLSNYGRSRKTNSGSRALWIISWRDHWSRHRYSRQCRCREKYSNLRWWRSDFGKPTNLWSNSLLIFSGQSWDSRRLLRKRSVFSATIDGAIGDFRKSTGR